MKYKIHAVVRCFLAIIAMNLSKFIIVQLRHVMRELKDHPRTTKRYTRGLQAFLYIMCPLLLTNIVNFVFLKIKISLGHCYYVKKQVGRKNVALLVRYYQTSIQQ